MFLTDASITSSFCSFFNISSSFPATVSDIFNAVQISSSSSLDCFVVLVFLCSGDEIESSESADVLFLRLFNRSVIILAIKL